MAGPAGPPTTALYHCSKMRRFELGSWDKQTDRQTDRQTDGRIDGRPQHVAYVMHGRPTLSFQLCHWLYRVAV